MRHLGGRVHHELALALVVPGEHRLAFQRHHALAGGAVLALDDDRGAHPDRLDVAVDRGRQEEVVVPLVVHARSVRAACGEAVGDRGQRFEVKHHRLGDILGLGPGRSDAERHALAGKAHLAAGERWIVGRLVRGQARLGPDRMHAFHVPGGEHPARVALGDSDGPDAGVREGAAHERHLPQPGEGEVAHELRLAGQMPGVFLARDASPDPCRHVRCLPRRSARGGIVPCLWRFRPPRGVARWFSWVGIRANHIPRGEGGACGARVQAGTLARVRILEDGVMNQHRLKAVAAVVFLAGGPCVYADTGTSDSAEPGEPTEASASVTKWEEVKREGGEAIGALKDAAGDSVKKLWSTAGERSEEALSATRDATGDAVGAARDATGDAVDATREATGDAVDAVRETSGSALDKVRDGSAAAVDSTRRGAEHAWQETREGSKRLLESAKPKAEELVDHVQSEGKEAWDATREAGRKLWQNLTEESTDKE